MPPKAEPKQYTPEGQSETTSIALDKATDSLQNAVKASIAELKNVYLDSQRSHNLKHKMDVQTMEQMKKEFDQELKTSGVKLDNATAQIKTLNTQLTEEKIKASEALKTHQSTEQSIRGKLESAQTLAARDQDNLKSNISELSKQLGVANTVIDKLKDEAKSTAAENKLTETKHLQKIDELAKALESARMNFAEKDSALSAANATVKSDEKAITELLREKSEASQKISSLNTQLESQRASTEQWQREADKSKNDAATARKETQVETSEKAKVSEAKALLEAKVEELSKKLNAMTAEAAGAKEKNASMNNQLKEKITQLAETKEAARLRSVEDQGVIANRESQLAETQAQLERLKQEAYNLYTSYTGAMQQMEEYRVALERETHESAKLHQAIAQQKNEAARDAVKMSSAGAMLGPPAGFGPGGSAGRSGGGSSFYDGPPIGMTIEELSGMKNSPRNTPRQGGR
jgi:chromosome segregation ATPase